MKDDKTCTEVYSADVPRTTDGPVSGTYTSFRVCAPLTVNHMGISLFVMTV